MIKDVMVWLDGSLSDEIRLEAAKDIAWRFDSQVIGLFLNPLPLLVPAEGYAGGPVGTLELMGRAREAGDANEGLLIRRLQQLERPVEIRRFDVVAEDIADVAAREARSADTFVALRPDGAMDPERLIEAVLFGSGRHLFLIPETERPKFVSFDRILVAWNGSRESARALAESMPFLHKAREVTLVIVSSGVAEENALLGPNAIKHLKHHGIDADLHSINRASSEAAAVLMAEAQRRDANLIVMGGYGHLRLRERLLGGVTYDLMHEASIPLLIAH